MKAEARYSEAVQPLKEENSPNPDIFLSVVIPAHDEYDEHDKHNDYDDYDEQNLIDDTVSTVKDYLQAQDFNSEIIIVGEGNYDRTTEVIKGPGRYVYDFKEQRSSRVKRDIENLGLGFSIARSILRTRGKYILCTDENLSTPIWEVEKLWPYVQGGADIVLTFPKIQAARIHTAQARQPRQPVKEKLMEYAVRVMARLMAINGIRYRHCTFKLLDQESAKSIARAQKLYGQSFDIEQLYLARALGFSIREVPVEWHSPKNNTASGQDENGRNDPIRLLRDILEILYIHRGLKRSSRHLHPNGSSGGTAACT